MEKLHLSAFINATPEKVWNTMLSDATYRQWTGVFMPGSYYKGSWEEGSKILFLGPNPSGKGEGGMVSQIETARPYEFLSIRHLGMVKDGVEDTTSENVKQWNGAHENYTFTKKDTGTELIIDTDTTESDKDFMEKAWKEGLAKLKELAEQI